MDGALIPTIEMAQNKAYTALFGVSTQEFFDFIQGDPSLLAGIPTLCAYWRRGGGGFPIKVDGEVVGASRTERGAHGAERHRLRESGPSALIRCGAGWTEKVTCVGGYMAGRSRLGRLAAKRTLIITKED